MWGARHIKNAQTIIANDGIYDNSYALAA